MSCNRVIFDYFISNCWLVWHSEPSKRVFGTSAWFLVKRTFRIYISSQQTNIQTWAFDPLFFSFFFSFFMAFFCWTNHKWEFQNMKERKSSKFHYQLLEPGNIRAIPYKNMVIWPYTLTSSSLQCLLCRALILCKTQVYNFNDLRASLWLRI